MTKNHSLKNLNTMGFNTIAKLFYEINSLDDLHDMIKKNIFSDSKTLILGGGSNIVFKDDFFDGIVIHSNIKGITFLAQESTDVIVRCMSGEIWKDFVDFTIENNLYGLENLVDIPGSVGASPVQNIGAYGLEVKDCIEHVYAIDISNGNTHVFNNGECHFAYRDSIFKREENKKYFIYAVDFKLRKKAELKIEYGNIKDYLRSKNIENPCLIDVADAIKAIRAEKLPEVGRVGSAGSFFQNPVVDNDVFLSLKEQFPDMPSYPHDKGVKIPAGWLIDKCGWKGYRENHVGVWDKQALVLVHYGDGDGREIIELMRKIQDSVKEKFGIAITPEVNII